MDRVGVLRQGKAGDKVGWCFDVYYDNRPYANVVSALFKTKLGAQRKLSTYLQTGKLDFYGNAE